MYLEADFPVEIEQKRRILQPAAKAARAESREAGVSVDHLVIDGKRYSINDLDQLPIHLQPAHIATRTHNNVMAFFTAACPLSNFYNTKFTAEQGKLFHSSEQLYQYYKAREFNDQISMNKILFCDSPSEAYNYGKNVENFDENTWSRKSRECMRKAFQAKFEQDEYAQNFLMQSGRVILAEANPHDKFWSTGLALKDDNVFDKNKWVGENQLGVLLTSYRDSLIH